MTTKIKPHAICCCLWLCLMAIDTHISAFAQLPNMGASSERALSPKEERKIGQFYIKSLEQRGLLLTDPELTEYINGLGYKLVAHSSKPQDAFEFFIVNDSSINAFALPGGYIGVNNGLIHASDSESELAGVLAHEISHVTQRHIARSVENSKTNNALTQAAILAAILLGGGDADVVQAAVGIGMTTALEKQVNFTRENESEADRVAIPMLAAAGIDPSGMAGFFAKLDQQSRLYEASIFDYLRTHPINTQRISDANNRAANYTFSAETDETVYRIMKTKLAVMTAQDPLQVITLFDTQLDKNKQIDRPVAYYGKALALNRLGKYDPAIRLLKALVNDHDNVLSYWLALALTQSNAGQSNQALETYLQATKLFPTSQALAIDYADMRLLNKEPEKTITLLAGKTFSGSIEHRRLRLLAEAEAARGRIAASHYYLAEYYWRKDARLEADRQIRLALKTEGLSDIQRTALLSRQKEIQASLAKGEVLDNRDSP